MPRFQVNVTIGYNIEAKDEEAAIDLAIELAKSDTLRDFDFEVTETETQDDVSEFASEVAAQINEARGE